MIAAFTIDYSNAKGQAIEGARGRPLARARGRTFLVLHPLGYCWRILWGDFWEKETVETLCIVPLRLPRYGRLIKRFARVSIEHVDVFGINVQCGSTARMHTGTRV